MVSRAKLGRQFQQARKQRGFRLDDVARRTGKNKARISEFENGKANSTIDFLDEAGAAVGMTLMFIPDDKVDAVNALIAPAERPSVPAYDLPSVFDELFVDETEGERDDGKC